MTSPRPYIPSQRAVVSSLTPFRPHTSSQRGVGAVGSRTWKHLSPVTGCVTSVAVHTLAPTRRQSPSPSHIQLPYQKIQERMSPVALLMEMTRLVCLQSPFAFPVLCVVVTAVQMASEPSQPHCPETLGACGAYL